LNTIKYKECCCTINTVNITDTTISSRGGLTFISHYLEKIKFYRLIDKKVTGFRASLKGKATSFIIRQILLFFIDGSHKASAFVLQIPVPTEKQNLNFVS
jgi:hypothetical protein